MDTSKAFAIYDMLCAALTNYENQSEENSCIDKEFKLYNEIVRITNEMQDALDPIF